MKAVALKIVGAHGAHNSRADNRDATWFAIAHRTVRLGPLLPRHTEMDDRLHH